MVKKIGIVALILVLLAGLMLFRTYDSPELGQALLEQVSQDSGVELSATSFRLSLLSGLVLGGVTGSSQAPGRQFDLTLDHLVFEHRLLPLLSGTVAIDRVVLERPQIVLVESPEAVAKEDAQREPKEPKSDQAPAAAETAGLALKVKEIRVEEATIVLKTAGVEGETRIEGLDFLMEQLAFDPQTGSLAALSAQGELSIREVSLDTLRITETSGRFQLADARFVVPELTCKTPYGPFGANLEVDFSAVPFCYAFSGRGDPLDVNRMLGATEGFGPASVAVEAEGAGPEPRDLTGNGRVSLAQGRFPAMEMLSRIDQALGKTAVVGGRYEATEATFKLKNNVVTLAPFRFTSDIARLDLEGWANLEGPLDLKLAVATPREGLRVEGVGSRTLDLLADDAGWVAVPMGVSGTLEEPKVRPDVKALASQAGRGAKREVKKKATESLRGLLGGKKP
jgi:uncharacterized protein involved in outer membrane biogenesis